MQGEDERRFDGVGGLRKRMGKMKVASESHDSAELDVKQGSKRRRSRKGPLSTSRRQPSSDTYPTITTDSSTSMTVPAHPTHTVEAQSLFATTRGLRCIPYITPHQHLDDRPQRPPPLPHHRTPRPPNRTPPARPPGKTQRHNTHP